MILAQISDLHILRRGEKLSGFVDTAAYLAKAVTRISQLNPQPDALLITGDMVDEGTEAEYAHLRELLAPLNMPMYVIPGNHDSREGIRAAFPDHGYLPKEGFLHYVIDSYPVQIIGLDTVVPNKGYGTLDEERLSWLAQRLGETDGKPTLVMMHHPPFITGINFMDRISLRNGSTEFGKLIGRHPNVERIICGHVHRSIETRIGSSIAMSCPATCHQIALELRTDGPEGFTQEPPGFRLHLWNGQQLISHTAAIGDFPGPYGFR